MNTDDPKTKIQVHIGIKQYEQLDKLHRKTRVSMSCLVRTALDLLFKDEQKKAQKRR